MLCLILTKLKLSLAYNVTLNVCTLDYYSNAASSINICSSNGVSTTRLDQVLLYSVSLLGFPLVRRQCVSRYCLVSFKTCKKVRGNSLSLARKIRRLISTDMIIRILELKSESRQLLLEKEQSSLSSTYCV